MEARHRNDLREVGDDHKLEGEVFRRARFRENGQLGRVRWTHGIHSPSSLIIMKKILTL